MKRRIPRTATSLFAPTAAEHPVPGRPQAQADCTEAQELLIRQLEVDAILDDIL